jgi:nucleoside transporter
MTETSNQMPMNTRIRLSIMMFLQYMMFAVWFVPLAAYLTNRGVEGWMKAMILSSMPLGCLISPIVCMIADRYFAGQKVLMVLNVACAVLFFIGAQVAAPALLFFVLLIAMLCYMPTWNLTNAIAMANCPSEQFPHIRLFGSIGWVAALVFSVTAKKFFETIIDGTAIPLYCGAGTALAAALLNFTLPNTPPPAKGKPASIVDALGLRSLGLLKDFNFAAFMILSMLVMIPFTMYFSLGSDFFRSKGYELITARMNWGQFAEMFLMLLVPISLARLGVKRTILIGLAGLVFRYVAFYVGGICDLPTLYYGAIIVHGVIFGFFFVGGQVYVDKKAPPEMRAQAQGLIGLMVFGVGWLTGNFFNVKLIDMYTTLNDSGEKVYNWDKIWIVTTAISVVLLIAFALLFKDDVKTAEAAAETPAPEKPATAAAQAPTAAES